MVSFLFFLALRRLNNQMPLRGDFIRCDSGGYRPGRCPGRWWCLPAARPSGIFSAADGCKSCVWRGATRSGASSCVGGGWDGKGRRAGIKKGALGSAPSVVRFQEKQCFGGGYSCASFSALSINPVPERDQWRIIQNDRRRDWLAGRWQNLPPILRGFRQTGINRAAPG